MRVTRMAGTASSGAMPNAVKNRASKSQINGPFHGMWPRGVADASGFGQQLSELRLALLGAAAVRDHDCAVLQVVHPEAAR